jgi:hypothetical protein
MGQDWTWTVRECTARRSDATEEREPGLGCDQDRSMKGPK